MSSPPPAQGAHASHLDRQSPSHAVSPLGNAGSGGNGAFPFGIGGGDANGSGGGGGADSVCLLIHADDETRPLIVDYLQLLHARVIVAPSYLAAAAALQSAAPAISPSAAAAAAAAKNAGSSAHAHADACTPHLIVVDTAAASDDDQQTLTLIRTDARLKHAPIIALTATATTTATAAVTASESLLRLVEAGAFG